MKDPDEPGRYIAGILTDGEMYSRAEVARDRDRLREEILRNLGWNIIHLWSSDWYRNREETQRKVSDRLEEIVEEVRVARESPETPETEQEVADEVEEPVVAETGPVEEAVDEVDESEVDESGGPDQEPPRDGAAEYVEYETDKLREPDDLYRSPTTGNYFCCQ